MINETLLDKFIEEYPGHTSDEALKQLKKVKRTTHLINHSRKDRPLLIQRLTEASLSEWAFDFAMLPNKRWAPNYSSVDDTRSNLVKDFCTHHRYVWTWAYYIGDHDLMLDRMLRDDYEPHIRKVHGKEVEYMKVRSVLSWVDAIPQDAEVLLPILLDSKDYDLMFAWASRIGSMEVIRPLVPEGEWARIAARHASGGQSISK